MKKYITTAVIVAGMLVGVSALATTSITLSPATVGVKAGQTFSVPVSANPQGVKNYTVELKVNYPADLLQVNSFTFGSQWMPLNQPGYDSIDNTNGALTKTAGYPQGFSSNVLFGTITFQAKKTGTGIISLASGTTALDQSNQNVFAGSSQVAVSIAALKAMPTSTPAPAPTAKTTLKTAATPIPSTTASGSQVISPLTMPSAAPPLQQATILGSLGSALSLGSGNWLITLVVILAIAYGAYWLIRRKLKK